MTLFIFIVFILCGWRLTSLIMYEEGPWDIFSKFRKIIGVKRNEQEGLEPNSDPSGFISKLFSCVYCFSIWVSFPLYLVWALLSNNFTLHEFLLLPLAASTAIIVVDKAIEKFMEL